MTNFVTIAEKNRSSFLCEHRLKMQAFNDRHEMIVDRDPVSYTRLENHSGDEYDLLLPFSDDPQTRKYRNQTISNI